MLMAEDLYLDTEQVDTSTILVTQGGNTSSSTTPQNAAGTSLISQPSQFQSHLSKPFQFPVHFDAQAPQFGPMYPHMPSSGQQSYGGNRSNRNYSSGQRSYGGNHNNRNYSMDFSFPPGSCQICGKTNHQASHCYHRQNLGYRPPQFGNQSGNQFGNQFGMSSQNQFGMSPQGFSSSSQRPQAFMLNVDNFGNSNQGYVYSPYSPNLQQQPSYISQGYTHMSPSPYIQNVGTNVGTPQGTFVQAVHNPSAPPSASPWYFDSGATAHVTKDAHQLIAPSYTSPAAVTVGNGQTVPVSTSGQVDQSSGSSGALPSRPLSPSTFF